jgi:hypothetical protein
VVQVCRYKKLLSKPNFLQNSAGGDKTYTCSIVIASIYDCTRACDEFLNDASLAIFVATRVLTIPNTNWEDTDVTISTRKVKKGSQTPVTSPQVPDSISDTIILARTTQGITKKPKTKEEQGLTPKNRDL